MPTVIKKYPLIDITILGNLELFVVSTKIADPVNAGSELEVARKGYNRRLFGLLPSLTYERNKATGDVISRKLTVSLVNNATGKSIHEIGNVVEVSNSSTSNTNILVNGKGTIDEILSVLESVTIV